MLATMVATRPTLPEYERSTSDDRRSVLVVDDEPGLRSLARWILESDGLTVETAKDGAEALARAFDHRPALVVLDLNLPELDGEGVARALWARYGSTVPIVVVSGNANVAAVALRIGAFSWLPKPFKVASLLHAVRHALEVRTMN